MFTSIPGMYDLFNVEPAPMTPALDAWRARPMTPRISFIVPVRNDAARLEICLRSILRNLGAPGQLEIVVVDNGSTDGSPDAPEASAPR